MQKPASIVQVGNATLRAKCVDIDKFTILQSKIQKLITSMHSQVIKVGGVGLAAPQVGKQLNLFVLNIAPTKFRPDIPNVRPYAVINPRIIAYGKTADTDYEGCFSVAEANLFAKVTRPDSVKVTYLNEKAELVSRTIAGFEARVFQHEFDHLQGMVFLDRKLELLTVMSGNEYRSMRAKKSTIAT